MRTFGHANWARFTVVGLFGVLGLMGSAWGLAGRLSGARSDAEAPSWPPAARPVELMARRAADWLAARNRPEGVFSVGFNPALNSACEDEHFLLQVRAAWALARSARVFRQSAYDAKAKQTVLVLLGQTRMDPAQPDARITQLPAASVNRLAAAAGLVLAIHALPEPSTELLTAAEQLAAGLRHAQLDTGLFRVEEAGLLVPPGHTSARLEVQRTQGWIIQALVTSYGQAPAPWKLEAAQRALLACRSQWQGQRQMELACSVIPGAVEAYLRTKDRTLAETAFEMAEWLTTLQYPPDPRAVHWQGGFMSWQEGQPSRTLPTLRSASALAALADACRAAREAGQVQTYERCRAALERGMVFLASLQYAPANCGHFAESYRPLVVGAFRSAPDDGKIRLSEHAEAVEACLRFLELWTPTR